RDFRADLDHFGGPQRRLLEPRLQGLPGDEFHYDIGAGEISRLDETRHMRPGEPWQDHALDLEADDVDRAAVHQRNLHDHRQGVAAAPDTPEVCHAAGIERRFETEAVNDLSGFEIADITRRR